MKTNFPKSKPQTPGFKFIGFWRTMFSRCPHNWVYVKTIQEPALFFVHNDVDIFTCSICKYSKKHIHY